MYILTTRMVQIQTAQLTQQVTAVAVDHACRVIRMLSIVSRLNILKARQPASVHIVRPLCTHAQNDHGLVQGLILGRGAESSFSPPMPLRKK